MSKYSFISVIVVNYNGKDFIGPCLDSVLASDYPRFEVVVLDNASTDRSWEYLKKAYGQNKKIKLFRSNKQLYFAGGNNFAVQKAKGEKLVFLNSDTVVTKSWLKELVNFAQNHARYLIQPKILFYQKKNIIDNVGGKYTFFGFGQGIGRGEKDRGQYDQNTRVDFVNGTCFLIEKKFFQQLGGFDPWYRFFYEDVDLCLRAKKAGGQCWYCFQSVIYHQGGLSFKNNVDQTTVLFHLRKNRLRTVTKNFTGGNRFLKLWILFFIYFILAIQDFFTFKPKRMFLTVRTILVNLSE